METQRGFLSLMCKTLAFLPVFVLLLLLGIIKAAIFGPLVFLVIFLGISAIIVGLFPCHAIWTCYCVLRTKKFGPFLKCILLLYIWNLALLWPISGIVGSFFTALGYGLFSPLMATFETNTEGSQNKLVSCFVNGTWSSILGGCTIVRDTADFCFHSYFSYMDELLEFKTDSPIEVRLSQIPGCIVAGILGVAVDVPAITIIVVYKAPVMLFKGWKRLLGDLIGRAGPFLETVCVPFAALSILLWPAAVAVASLMGIIASFFLGCYGSFVAYQENSTKQGLRYAVSAISLFDEYTNDLLYLREGSCFPRLRYRNSVPPDSSPIHLKQPSEAIVQDEVESQTKKAPPTKTEMKAIVIWNNLFKACKLVGQELVSGGVIWASDLEEWQHSKNSTVNIGIPGYVFLLCFLRSIKSGSAGFVMIDKSELTSVNRPEGRVFDWFFEPMTIMKEQIKVADLNEIEEAYLKKLTLFCGNVERVRGWQNGGVPPVNEVRRAQLEGISRRIQGFGLVLSRMPTFRRRFHVIVKSLLSEAIQIPEEVNINGV